MARTLNPTSHAVRRDAFLDAAMRLIQTRGYEQMSVQTLLDELDASRGAFYHYFDSKQALLDAVVDRMADQALASLDPLLSDPTVPALRKLEGIFQGLAAWKAERKEFVLALMQVWLSDDNAIVREKYRRGVLPRLAPLLAAVIRQGRAEGVFTPTSADEAARVLVALLQGAGEAATDLFVDRQARRIPMEVVERFFAGYTEAVERILGLPAGTITFADEPTIRMWFE
jgi:AcrR family transcriptional regulator